MIGGWTSLYKVRSSQQAFCYNAVAYGEIITVTRQNQLDSGDDGVAPNFTPASVPCTK